MYSNGIISRIIFFFCQFCKIILKYLDMTQVEKNKQLVTTAYQRIFGDLDSTGIDEFIS
mgnify:CR=1 FL=1